MDLASLQAERQRMLAKLRDTAAQADERISAGRHKIALQGEASKFSTTSFLKPADGPQPEHEPPVLAASPRIAPQAEAAAALSASFSATSFLKPRSEPEPEPEPEPDPSSPASLNGSFPKVWAALPTPGSPGPQLQERDVKRELWDAAESQPEPQFPRGLTPQRPSLQHSIDEIRGAAPVPTPVVGHNVTPCRDTEREFALLGEIGSSPYASPRVHCVTHRVSRLSGQLTRSWCRAPVGSAQRESVAG
jgi:hypothetical protein